MTKASGPMFCGYSAGNPPIVDSSSPLASDSFCFVRMIRESDLPWARLLRNEFRKRLECSQALSRRLGSLAFLIVLIAADESPAIRVYRPKLNLLAVAIRPISLKFRLLSIKSASERLPAHWSGPNHLRSVRCRASSVDKQRRSE